MRTFDSLFFDLDGTLWSPLPLSLYCWREACRVHAVPADAVTEENLRHCFGKSPTYIMSILLPGCSSVLQKQVCETAFAMENRNIVRFTDLLYPGVREILEQLAEDYPLFIVSNCQAGYIEAFLDAYHLSALFIDFRSSEVSGRTKAENIQDLVQRYALRSPVYIGDTQLDAEAAALAEVPFIYASYGFETVTGADYTITGFADLLSVLEQ